MPENVTAHGESSKPSGGNSLSATTPAGNKDEEGQQKGTLDTASDSHQEDGDSRLHQSRELTPPPLPPRPPLGQQTSSLRTRPQLLSTPTTALSMPDVQAQSHGEGASLRASPVSKPVSRKHSFTHFSRFVSSSSNANSDGDDSASIKSYIPSLDARMDNESVLGDVIEDESGPFGIGSGSEDAGAEPFEIISAENDAMAYAVEHELDDMDPGNFDGMSEDDLLDTWKHKLKHFFILSASGKPIYSRHGEDQTISHYVGVAQTLISFYQGSKDPLRGFLAGGTRFVMLSKGPLNLIAISRLPESESQLRSQLEALYTQILSTLTLPSMETMFSKRPSTDLRRPLQGTDVLLDGLADGFTRGSPSTLLSALECLRLRKTHRRAINDTLLKVRSPDLLYGLIVAAGRLVSVVRPKKHSLHPGDLHLVFNMLFEAGSVKANGGENWIPLCLPGFNNTGFVYMYVSFISTASDSASPISSDHRSEEVDDELAIVLISPSKEAFYNLRKMRDDLLSQLHSTGSLANLRASIAKSHDPATTRIPGLHHYLYKSRANVQFTSPPLPSSPFHRRKLMNVYAQLHESIHSRTAHLKVQHLSSDEASALVWETPLFELYCVAAPSTSREDLVKGANRVVQWVRREEERVFIIGGAVF